jgi:hypothetical protein
MQQDCYAADDDREFVIGKARLHTIHHRNSFFRSDCETVVPGILRRFDKLALEEVGFRFSDMFMALVAVRGIIEHRYNEFFDHYRDACQAKSCQDILSQIRAYFGIPAWPTALGLCARSAARLLKNCDRPTFSFRRNDVVAIIGNTIFLFEAKSGRLDEVARRGGDFSFATLRSFSLSPVNKLRALRIISTLMGRMHACG